MAKRLRRRRLGRKYKGALNHRGKVRSDFLSIAHIRAVSDRGMIFLANEKLLYPFPKNSNKISIYNNSVFAAVTGQSFYRAVRYSRTSRNSFLKRQQANLWLAHLVHQECVERIAGWLTSIPEKIRGEVRTPGEIKEVIWRHTGSYGNQARNFLFIDEENHLYLFAKIGRRYRLVGGEMDSILSSVPDNMFPSAVKAYAKWEKTGEPTWWQSIIPFKEWKEITGRAGKKFCPKKV